MIQYAHKRVYFKEGDFKLTTTPTMKIPLHDYQIFAKDFVLSHPYCGLFLKMGLGKTSIVLESLWELNPSGHVLVIAPKTIARCTWANEIEKWGLPFRTQSLLVNERGKQLTKKKREEIYATIPTAKPTVYFINREMVVDLINHFPDGKWCFPNIIIDECQSFKSYNTERFRKLKTIRPYVFRMVLLTGSPAPGGLEDLWSQLYLLDMGERLCHSISKYREQYFNPGMIVNNHPVQWTPKPEAEDIIYNRISDLVISMKNDFIKLPPLTLNNITVEMDEAELKRYQEFKKTFVLDLVDGTQIEAANAAVLSAKLSQMASGSIYKETGSHEYEVVHTQKLDMCKHVIENTDSSVLIAYRFQSDKDMLLKYFAKEKMDAVVFDMTPEMLAKWNDKQIPIMLIQPASCGFGLNLQAGGDTLIWYTLPWSLEQYEQTNARIYRQGQTNPVVIHHILTKQTIDTKILKAIETKDMRQQRLIDAVEAELKPGN